nr:mucin-5AC-like [Dermacentor andersoni]
MDTGGPPKPVDDTDMTEDDAEMECVSDEEGIPGGAGASSTSGTATTEADMEESVESSEPVAETEVEMKDSAETSPRTAETEAEMKDSAETSNLTVETEAEMKDSTETSKLTVETEAEMKDSVEASQRTVETEAEMKDSAETSQPTAEKKDSAETSQPTAEKKDSAETLQLTAETKAEMEDLPDTSLSAAVAGPSRTKQVAESSSSDAETTEQRSSDEGRMVVSPSQPSTSRGLGAATRPLDLPLKSRRRKHPVTPDEERQSASSTSVSPAAKQPRHSTSSDTEDGPTPAERALAEACALERPSANAELSYSDLSSSGSARPRPLSPPSLAANSTPDVSSGIYSDMSTPSNVPDEEEGGEEAPAIRPDTPSEGEGMAAGEGMEVGSASSSSDGSARQPGDPRPEESPHQDSPVPFAEGSSALQASSCESLGKPIARRPVLLCPDSSTTTSSVSSPSDSNAGGGVGVLSRTTSFQEPRTSQPEPAEDLPRSETFAGPLSLPTSPDGSKSPASWTLPPAEILGRAPDSDEAQQQQEGTSTSISPRLRSSQQESKQHPRTSSSSDPHSPGPSRGRVLEKEMSSPTAGPSGEAGTSGHGALSGPSSREEGRGQQEGTTASTISGQAFGSSTGSGQSPQPMPMEEESEDSEAHLRRYKQQASVFSRELVTPFRDPQSQRTMTVEEWDAAKRSTGSTSGQTSQEHQPGHSTGQPGDDSNS